MKGKRAGVGQSTDSLDMLTMSHISGANRCTRNCTAQNCAESVSSYFRPKCLVTFHHD